MRHNKTIAMNHIRRNPDNCAEREHEKMHNPYNNRSMLPHDSDMFFGREAEMDRMIGMLSCDNPQSISIIGERRIGKSSLANRVYHRISGMEKHVAAFLDCGGLADSCESRDDFFRELNDRFHLEQEAFGRNGDGLFRDYSTFKRFVEKQAKIGYRFFIFLDEFEKLPKKSFADNSFFSNLRSMADRPDSKLAFVTISQKSLKDLTHKAIDSSEFHNIFSKEMVGLIDEKSAVALRTQGFLRNGFALSEEEFLQIHRYAGAFPFFNQMVCSVIFDAKLYDTPVEWHCLENQLMDHYDKLWASRSREEKVILKNLAKGEHKDEFVLKKLRARGLVKCANGVYSPFSTFFSDLIATHFQVESRFKRPTFKDILDGVGKTGKLLDGLKKIKSSSKDVFLDGEK